MEIKRKICNKEVNEGDLVIIKHRHKLKRGFNVGFITFNVGLSELFGCDFMLFDTVRLNKMSHKGYVEGFNSNNILDIEVVKKNAVKEIVGEENWNVAWE